MVDVHVKLKMFPATLYLAVNIADRFLSVRTCSSSKLRLGGGCALWIACKYEEASRRPVLDYVVHLASDKYTREHMVLMEATICNTLEFRLSVVTPLSFMTRTLEEFQGILTEPDARITHVANYAMELSLRYHKMLHYRSSLLAATAVAQGAYAMGYNEATWNDTMQFYSGGYALSDLKPCAYRMWYLVHRNKNTETTTVRRKYMDVKFGHIAKLADCIKLKFDT